MFKYWYKKHADDQYVVAIVPYFNEYSYDVFIFPKRHYGLLKESTRRELESFAEILPKIIIALRVILKSGISYSLSLHQSPLNTAKSLLFHLYFKAHTPQKDEHTVKHFGAVETATKTFINEILLEEVAAQLKSAIM